MYSKEEKLEAIRYFLNEILNDDYLLIERKKEMIRVGKRFCQGFPEWSDYWGNVLKAIDDVSLQELKELIEHI